MVWGYFECSHRGQSYVQAYGSSPPKKALKFETTLKNLEKKI